MKLERFKEKNNKMIGVVLFTIICILLIGSVILYKTFASFEVNHHFNIINGTIEDTGDLKFLVYVNGELEKNVPSKESGYTLNTEKSKCENGNIVSWNQERWSVEIKTISTTKTKCYLYFEEIYEDPTLNGAVPDLGNELVAITFNETGQAIKANLASAWYDYSKQEWANAVILRTKEEYEDGTLIPEENIESYFVWIPRYRYELWNGVKETDGFAKVAKDLGSVNASEQSELNQSRKINIVFETKNSMIQKGANQGDWFTHPAFVSFNSNGFWTGKFETGYNQDPEGETRVTPNTSWTLGGAHKDEIAPNKIIIKPNVYSWSYIKVADAFKTVYEYKRELDSHMMKNTEWGAVAYLTNSEYGRCPNGVCEEVRINNSANYVTGSSAVNPPTCGYIGSNELCNKYDWNTLGQDTDYVNNYNNSKSVASSTTGNYTGVFDMSGGSWEYVMGVMLDKEGQLVSGRDDDFNSNFVGTLMHPKDSSKTAWTESDGGLQWPDSRYYDTYSYAETDQAFNRGLFGDATKELGFFYQIQHGNITRRVSEWNADNAFFVYNEDPWFLRSSSGLDGTDAGIFSFRNEYGHGTGASFRVVLTP